MNKLGAMPDLKIAVLSDTHNHLPEKLLDLIAPADEIWHLGDVCGSWVVSALELLRKPLIVVQGNCDPFGIGLETITLERNGDRFVLQHRPPDAIDLQVDAYLFGHLHHPVDQRQGRTRLLNPGAISSPRQDSASSFAWLKIDAPGEWTWEVVEI